MADTNYNSMHTGPQIDDAIARALPGGAIDTALQNKLGGIESTEYPGCYYRTVDGAVEWFNPPMLLSVEYRTTERYLGKPVYVRLHNFGALPNSTFKEDSSPASWSIDKAICAYGTTSDGITIPTNNYAGMITTGRHISLYFSPSEIVVATDANRTNISATLFLKYTKTTD